MWTWFFQSGTVTNYEEAARSDTAAFGRFHRALLEQGIWLPPSQFEAAFLVTRTGFGNSRDHRGSTYRVRGGEIYLVDRGAEAHASRVTKLRVVL